MTTEATTVELAELYRVRKGTVAFVDVPELGYVMVDGVGPPDGAETTRPTSTAPPGDGAR